VLRRKEAVVQGINEPLKGNPRNPLTVSVVDDCARLAAFIENENENGETVFHKKFFSHIREDGRQEPLIEHLRLTAKKASDFGAAIGSRELAYAAGMLHDIGKYSDAFQNRLLHNGHKVDHATAGAKECHFSILEYCIAGHHSGLLNGGTSDDVPGTASLQGRLKKDDLPPYSAFQSEPDIMQVLQLHFRDILPEFLKPNEQPDIQVRENTQRTKAEKQNSFFYSLSFYTRMLFSCLVDADFLATEEFMSPGNTRDTQHSLPEELHRKYHQFIQQFRKPQNELNIERNRILSECLEAGKGNRGLFTLTVATGGGKTLASMGFAIEQMRTHHLDRIIYVIPYTSIIQQTATIFKRIFGEDDVLEHHMKVDYESYKEKGEDEDNCNEQVQQKKLATENWDARIIVTTNVQFFESLHGNRTSVCRKLHHIANSIIIFDEVQCFPREELLACTRSIEELVLHYHCTAVLCSATQPALTDSRMGEDFFFERCYAKEINSKWKEGAGIFKRTQMVYDGEITNDDLADRLSKERQVLCIVNTRKHARELFEVLPESEENIHLSTLMKPEDIQTALRKVNDLLGSNQPCRVVATSLVEAGVDLDFETVYRAESGLDSQVQAAGRCNREGKRPVEESIVHIFKPEAKYAEHAPTSMKQTIVVCRQVREVYGEMDSPEAIREYFSSLYYIKGKEELDKKEIITALQKKMVPYADVAERFQIIEAKTIPILIPDGEEAKACYQALRFGKLSRNLMRKAARYCVSVYPYDAMELTKSGVITSLQDDVIFVLNDEERYSRTKGLEVTKELGEGIFL
jgi:CRISPR-associated endonuclease/helicase Cas3